MKTKILLSFFIFFMIFSFNSCTKNKISNIDIPHEDRYALNNLGIMAAEGEIKDDDPIWD